MNEETKGLLLECKKAGYEYVAIGVADKRVPISMKIEKYGDRKYSQHPSGGDYWGQGVDRDGNLAGPARVISAAPNKRESGRPAIWDICKKSHLTAGLDWRGSGCGESHQITRNHNLDCGCYELKDIKQ
jgi:hypothetical protein